MEFLESLKAFELWNNTGFSYLIALGVLIGALLVLKIFREIVLTSLRRWAKRTKTDIDDAIIGIVSNVRFITYLVLALYLAVRSLSLPSLVSQIIGGIFVVLIVYEVIRAVEKVFDYIFRRYASRSGETVDESQAHAMSGVLRFIVRLVLWALGLVLILSNLGVNVTSLVAGLGIGGIAVALAIQNVLADLFSALSIYIDRPFQVGDFIVIGTDRGTVERIGLKTTRIRSITGEELVVSNRELTDARVQNFGRLERRRAQFNLGVVYDTKPNKLKQIPEIIQDIIGATKGAEFDRCYFKEYGDSALNFEIVYWVNSAEYKDFVRVKQQVNLAIYERFAKEKIEFAYPTQTLYLEK